MALEDRQKTRRLRYACYIVHGVLRFLNNNLRASPLQIFETYQDKYSRRVNSLHALLTTVSLPFFFVDLLFVMCCVLFG